MALMDGDGVKIKTNVPATSQTGILALLTMVLELMAAACLVVVAVMFAYFMCDMGFSRAFIYEPADENPLFGYAGRADDAGLVADLRLVYIDVTWAEWEPEEGEFAVEALEASNNVMRWKAEGKHAVLRFVCDMPDAAAHRDIPAWLYERTGDGVDYDLSCGKGYAPDYSNPVFVEAHARALEALGRWASQDDFVSYVELGSLGHWGEWHTLYTEVPSLPDEATCGVYVDQYVEAFPRARLLMRRNYALGVDRGLGVYNDMAGHPDSTLTWLEWQCTGGSYEVPGCSLPYEPVESVWDTAPVGGELTSALSMRELLDDHLDETLELMCASHMTFLGPNMPAGEYADLPGARQVEATLGYRLWIERIDATYNPLARCWHMAMVWRTDGAAPLYFDWPAALEIRDASGAVVDTVPLDLALSELAGDEVIHVYADIPYDMRMENGFTVHLGITDPLTSAFAVRLSMDVPYDDGLNELYERVA